MEEKVEENINKVIIVTGGSRGIGKDIVYTLALKGYNIILNYNKSQEEAEAVKKDLQEQGKIIDIFKADVSKREEVNQLVKFVIDKFGRIDVLINNAGISQFKVFSDITDNDWEKMIANNLSSVFYMCQECLEHMIKQKDGCIINISSIWGITGASCESHYSVSKAGIDALTKSLAKELGPSNIRVNSIAPGIIDTDMNRNLTQEEKEEIILDIPLERIGKAHDISKCVAWLIEDDYVTGQIISINGGWLI